MQEQHNFELTCATVLLRFSDANDCRLSCPDYCKKTGRKVEVNSFHVQCCRLTKWVPMPGRMTRQVVEENINKSRRRMDVPAIDMLQFHWSAPTSFSAELAIL